MPVAISVGPPAITINQGNTFMVTNLRGEIDPYEEHGVFARDTRFISAYRLTINQAPWTLLSSSPITYYSAGFEFVNPALQTEDGELTERSIGLSVVREIAQAIDETLAIANHGLKPARFFLEVLLRSDFADIFEVRTKQIVRRGRIITKWDAACLRLTTSYEHRDFQRSCRLEVCASDSVPLYANGRVSYEIALEPGQRWQAKHAIHLIGEASPETVQPSPGQQRAQADARQADWHTVATNLTSSNEDVYRAYHQSIEDMGALRMEDGDSSAHTWVPVAGIPWYATIFGRDSLIVALQTMAVNPGLGVGTLHALAQLQATAADDWRDAQPGKIPHEIRFGELAHFGKVPHTPYYGSADATPLYLITLHETWLWTGDRALIERHRDTAERCLEWIDRFGDLDNDGFQEYLTRSTQGLENQGWKDSGDAVVDPDGARATPPIALCELQGYVYDAKRRMAEIFEALGAIERAGVLRQQAEDLRLRFEAAFWLEDEGIYSFGLNAHKQPIRTVVSNAGHCLWSGIASPERAARVVQRLMRDDMSSGWGIRTLSASQRCYNPHSYHRGSVWPHDNAIIVAGFRRYGFVREAGQLARGIWEAAAYFDSYRLPELYAGLPRAGSSFPVQYLGANIPQAWAAGAILHLIRTLVGLRADMPHGRLYVDPALPHWLPDLRLGGLRCGDAQLSLHFWRDDQRSRWEVVDQVGQVEVLDEPQTAVE
ncbi:MAG TPA: glycogen debranching N-terminal domain-containing protein [Roseiflexaceae bacterium]|nr:glycogen debranching N-terminal domain-containing protein [Roseiflexaceae bacterium]